MKITRRNTLKFGGLAAAGVAGLALPYGRSVNADTPSLLSARNTPKPYQVAFKDLETLSPLRRDVDGDGHPVHYYDITAKAGAAAILPSLLTPVLGYDGLVPAKKISVDQGTKIVMTMRNKLPATHPLYGKPIKISTHLHGSASLPQYDGYADDTTAYGQSKVYRYANDQPARTIWYHDHGVHYTAQNAYSGLASQYHIKDKMERSLLPQGEFDVALTLSDMMFQANGALRFDDRSHSGLWGDVILINGRPWPVLKVKRRIYRFRLLNASISRSYNIRLSNGAPMHMVATDGGLMPRTQAVTSFRTSSSERYEFLVDFSKVPVGTRVELRNTSNKNNRDYTNTNKIMAFDVVGDSFTTDDPAALVVPTELNPGNQVMALQPSQSVKTRTIRVQRDDVTNVWNLNGESWDEVVASGYKKVLANPDLDDVEIWNVQNNSGGWFHPFHTHLVDFKILSRNGRAPFKYELGPKDTVYVGEGETVKLLMKFGPHRGRYMVHCHNLPHEDHDMMHQFSVGMSGGDYDNDPNDPIYAAPPVND